MKSSEEEVVEEVAEVEEAAEVEVVRSGDSAATLEEVEMLVDLVEEEEALDPISEAVEEEEEVVVVVHLLPKVSFN